MDFQALIRREVSFDWDEWNIRKNWEKHRVSPAECEDVFFNGPIVEADSQHSQQELRYVSYGSTDQRRLLFIVFMIRREKIRVISARDVHRKEREVYHAKIKDNPTV